VQDDALTAVNELFSSFEDNYQELMRSGEVSFATEYKGQFGKVVLLACASYFETKLSSVVLNALNPSDCLLTDSFISKKALKRQYHTLFGWEMKNANSFFGLFGKPFQDYMKEKVKGDSSLDSAIKDFLELGKLRNQLVHDNYATFILQLTVEDIKKKFESAQVFASAIEPSIADFRVIDKN